MKGRSM
jgi:hypothetical protein